MSLAEQSFPDLPESNITSEVIQGPWPMPEVDEPAPPRPGGLACVAEAIQSDIENLRDATHNAGYMLLKAEVSLETVVLRPIDEKIDALKDAWRQGGDGTLRRFGNAVRHTVRYTTQLDSQRPEQPRSFSEVLSDWRHETTEVVQEIRETLRNGSLKD